jgi:hypothetical protein
MISLTELQNKRISPTEKFLIDIENRIINYDYQELREFVIEIPNTGVDMAKVYNTLYYAGYTAKRMETEKGYLLNYLRITWE